MSVQQKSHLSRPPTSVPILPISTMKDISSSKNVRTSLYPRKRPSLHGISKARGQKDSPPPHTSHPNTRKSPRNIKAEQLAHKQREAKISALRREGIYLEEEYREEIRRYMHEMEVCNFFFPLQKKTTAQVSLVSAIYDVFCSINGSTTRDSMAHATLSR